MPAMRMDDCMHHDVQKVMAVPINNNKNVEASNFPDLSNLSCKAAETRGDLKHSKDHRLIQSPAM